MVSTDILTLLRDTELAWELKLEGGNVLNNCMIRQRFPLPGDHFPRYRFVEEVTMLVPESHASDAIGATVTVVAG
jgi:hypothetical protein